MGKCKEDEVKKCKRMVKKCEKDKQCDCKEDASKRKDPKMRKEDLLWSYFAFKMLTEMLAETSTREKIKEYTTNKPNEYEQAFALDMLQDMLNIKEGTILPEKKKDDKEKQAAAPPAKPPPTKKEK